MTGQKRERMSSVTTCVPTQPEAPPEKDTWRRQHALNVSLLKSLHERGAAFLGWPLALLKQLCYRGSWRKGSAFDKSMLQHLYESGVPWSEIEAAFPDQTWSALDSRCHRSGWHAPTVHRTSSKRPSQPNKAVDVTMDTVRPVLLSSVDPWR